jgi:hypothetical protein
VIGCVYIYPLPNSDHEARVLSWVRASHPQLDTPLWRTVSEWLASDWPFGRVEYARLGAPSSRAARFRSGAFLNSLTPGDGHPVSARLLSPGSQA